MNALDTWRDRMSLVVMEPLASGIERPWTLESYLKIGGYSSWRKVLAGELTREQIIDGVKASVSR